MERQRQIDEEGWTADHDDEHDVGDLAAVGALYAIESTGLLGEQAGHAVFDWLWPRHWDEHWWKPGDHEEEERPINNQEGLRCLEKAGALIAAEIDRRLREMKRS